MPNGVSSTLMLGFNDFYVPKSKKILEAKMSIKQKTKKPKKPKPKKTNFSTPGFIREQIIIIITIIVKFVRKLHKKFRIENLKVWGVFCFIDCKLIVVWFKQNAHLLQTFFQVEVVFSIGRTADGLPSWFLVLAAPMIASFDTFILQRFHSKDDSR